MRRILIYLFFEGAVAGSFLALWQPQALQRGLGVTALSFYVAFEMIFALVTDIPTGSLADRIGHRKVALSGIALYVVSFLIAVGTRGEVGLIVCALTMAFAGSLMSGALDAWISEVSEITSFKRRDQLASFGRAFGALSIPALATTFGWDLHPGQVWIPHLILGSCSLLIALSIPKSTTESRRPTRQRSQSLSISFSNYFSKTKEDLMLAWSDSNLQIFLVVSFLIGFTDGTSALAFRPRLVEIGMTTAAAFGFLQAGMSVARTTGVSLFPRLLRVEGQTGMLWSLLLASSFAAVFPFVKVPGIACALWLSRNFCLSYCFPSLKAGAAQTAKGTDRMATTLSTLSTMSTLGGFIAAFSMAGIGVERLGLPAVLLLGNSAQFYGAYLIYKKLNLRASETWQVLRHGTKRT